MTNGRVWVALVFCGLLSACGGGSQDNASPGGAFESTDSNTSAFAVITENGDGFIYVSTPNSAIYRLQATTSGDNLTGTFRGYGLKGTQFPNGSSVESGTVTGMVKERTSLTATYLGPNNSSGTIDAKYDAQVYSVPTSLSVLIGTYQFDRANPSGGDNITVTLNIDSSAKIVGSDSSGCAINGTVSIPDSQYSAQQLKFSTTCSGTTQNFTGVSVFAADPTSKGTLLIEYDDGVAMASLIYAQKQ